MTAPLLACFDFHVRSQIDLPELLPAVGADARDVLDIGLGSVPATLTGEGCASGWSLQFDGTRALFVVPDVARFLIEGTRSITVEPAPEAGDNAVRLFLLGSAIGIVGHLRGLLLLHANAVVAGSRAVAFAGASGAGKSTLAGRFAAAGYPVLSDDVCAIGFDGAGAPMVWPGVPRIKLWADAADALGRDRVGLEPVRDGLDKFAVPMGLPALEPHALTSLYVLERAQADGPPAPERLTGRAAVEAILANTYRREYLPTLGMAAAHFRLCAQLAGSIEVVRYAREWGYQAFDREFARLCRHLDNRPEGAARDDD